jgi:zinc/manganese transport system substrate-binding protein
MRPRLAVVAIATLLAFLAGCTSRGGSSNGIDVVATTTQAADLARSVGGGRVHVKAILRPNADPHEYEPRPSDALALRNADLVIRSGGDVDDWLGGLLRNAGRKPRELTLLDVVRRQQEHGSVDPHWWQDPRNGIRAVGAIQRALARVDPAGAKAYRLNGRRYVARLARLDHQIALCIGRIPPGQRKLVTTHDALGYYARRYGITVVGALIPSLSTQAAPSARQTQALVGQIRREHVKAIYPESSINPKLERAVARETGARVGGALWADTLGPKGSSGRTYISSLVANTASLVSGLTGGAASCRPRA